MVSRGSGERGIIMKRVGHYKVRTCTVCGTELNRHQIKYCTTHSIMSQLRRPKWTVGLSDEQLRHWYGF